MIILLLLLSLDVSHATLAPVPIPQNVTTNWTTCEEFLEGTKFDASRVLDKDWQVFYMWSMVYEEPYQVRFRVPTAELIERFKIEARNLSFSPGDWNTTAFFMESTLDLSALFLSTPTPGKFQVITSLVFQYRVNEVLFFAMKIMDPGYLAFMNCKLQVVVALAPVDVFPKDKEVEGAAKVFGIRHPFGYPHNVRDPTLEYSPALAGGDDDADDEQDLEVRMANVGLD